MLVFRIILLWKTLKSVSHTKNSGSVHHSGFQISIFSNQNYCVMRFHPTLSLTLSSQEQMTVRCYKQDLFQSASKHIILQILHYYCSRENFNSKPKVPSYYKCWSLPQKDHLVYFILQTARDRIGIWTLKVPSNYRYWRWHSCR